MRSSENAMQLTAERPLVFKTEYVLSSMIILQSTKPFMTQIYKVLLTAYLFMRVVIHSL